VRGPRAVIAFAATITLLAIGCEPPSGKVFTTVFPAIDGDVNGSIDIDALPVTFRDLTGTVTGIGPSDVRTEDQDFTRGRAEPVQDKTDALRVLWLAGACERDVEMSLGQVESKLVLRIHANSAISIFGGTCPALGVPRSVVISFDREVAAGDIDVRTDLDDED
jgi:hypothetical protein